MASPLTVKYPSCVLVAVGMLALASCGKSPPLTAAENLRVDRAMIRVKAEQDRTDGVQRQRQAAVLAALKQRPGDEMPIAKMPSRDVQQHNLGQRGPAENLVHPVADQDPGHSVTPRK